MENSMIVEKIISRINASKNTGSNDSYIVIDSVLTLEFSYPGILKAIINKTEVAKFSYETENKFFTDIRTALANKRREEKNAALNIL